jgi:hypothetical protein
MISPSASASSSRDLPWVVTVGVLVGASMIGLSLTGLLGRLTTTSAAMCLLLALAAAVACDRRLGPSWIPRLAWLGCPWVAPLALAALLPPYGWDEVAYGAALPRDFARAGRFFYNVDYGAYAAFPANYESLVTASLLLTGDVWASQLLNVVLALALAVIAVLLARALGVSRVTSLLAGLFVLCAPALIEVAPRTKNDVANAFFQSLAVLVLVTWLERPGYRAAVLAGAFLGVAVGIKYSSVHFVAALAPFGVWLLTRSAVSPVSGLRKVLVWTASLAVFASPWYVRNLVLFGNPVFPFMNDLPGIHNGFTPEQSVLLRESFDGLSDFSFRTGTTAMFIVRVVKEFGVLPMTLLWPGALLALRPGRRRVGVLPAGTAVSYAGMTLLVGYWAPRYFLSLLVIGSALASLALGRLQSALERTRFAPPGLARLALLAFAVFAAWGGYPFWMEHWRNVDAVRHRGREAFVNDRVAYLDVARWLNGNMGSDDKVAIGFNVQPFYYLERPYYHIHPLTEGDLVAAQTPEQVEAALRRVGATLLAFSGSDGTYVEDTAPMICAYRQRLWWAQRLLRKAGRLRLLTTINGVRILRLAPVQPAAAVAQDPAPRGR